MFAEELLLTMIHNTTNNPLPLPKSCQKIKQRMSTSPAGVYLIATSGNNTQYCMVYTQAVNREAIFILEMIIIVNQAIQQYHHIPIPKYIRLIRYGNSVMD